MGKINHFAQMTVIEDKPNEMHLMTEVFINQEVTIIANGITIANTWRCTGTGDIGTGKAINETKSWMLLAANDQTGKIAFVIHPDDDDSQKIMQFSIDVSSALQEGKIQLRTEFPFFLKMEGKGVIENAGGRFANGTRINYKIVNKT